MSGTGGTTQGVDIDQKRIKLNDAAWHTVVLEVDDQHMALGRGEGMTPTRSRCELISGGQSAWYDEIKVWKAEPDDKWPQKKAQLLQLLKKKAEPVGK